MESSHSALFTMRASVGPSPKVMNLLNTSVKLSMLELIVSSVSNCLDSSLPGKTVHIMVMIDHTTVGNALQSSTSIIGLTSGIAYFGGASTDQNDRLVSLLLQHSQYHDLEEGAHVKALSRSIEPYSRHNDER